MVCIPLRGFVNVERQGEKINYDFCHLDMCSEDLISPPMAIFLKSDFIIFHTFLVAFRSLSPLWLPPLRFIFNTLSLSLFRTQPHSLIVYIQKAARMGPWEESRSFSRWVNLPTVLQQTLSSSRVSICLACAKHVALFHSSSPFPQSSCAMWGQHLSQNLNTFWSFFPGSSMPHSPIPK